MNPHPFDVSSSVSVNKNFGPMPFYHTHVEDVSSGKTVEGNCKTHRVAVHYPTHWWYRGFGS